MPEPPTATEALESLAAEFDRRAATVTSAERRAGYAGAAQVARSRAAALAATAPGPQTGSTEGPQPGERDGELRPALDAVIGMLDLDAWEHWLGGYGNVRDLVGRMLAAAEPFIRADALRTFADELVLSPVAAFLARDAADELERSL